MTSPDDLFVEYVRLPDALAKAWCIKRRLHILGCDAHLDPVLNAARLLGVELHCAVWLRSEGLTIPVEL